MTTETIIRQLDLSVGAENSLAKRADGFLIKIFNRLYQWQELRRQRALLCQLSDETLKDVGLNRSDVCREWANDQ